MTEEELLARLGVVLADHGDDPGDLLSEVLDGARDEVRTVLRRVMVREQLRRVLTLLEKDGHGGHPEAPADLRTVVHLHGVVPTSAHQPWRPDGDVRLVNEGPVTGLVRDVPAAPFERLGSIDPADAPWFEAELRRHEQVLEEARAQVAVVPLRFGCLLKDDGRVRELMRAHTSTLISALSRIADHDEWHVRVHLKPVDVPGDHDVRVRGIERHLSTLATEVEHRPTTEEGEGANLALLVSRTVEQRLHRDLEMLAEEHGPHGLALEVSGPWPAYSFVPALEAAV